MLLQNVFYRKATKMKFTHNLTVSGEKLTLCSEDEPDYVEKLASELSRRISTTMLSGADVSKTDAAIVCALDLLNENYKLKVLLEDYSHEKN